MSAITAFLEGKGCDAAGRTFDEIVAFDPFRLEHRHDYIQWLFPLAEPSGAVAGAPVLTPADTKAIRRSLPAQARLETAVDVMQQFYADSDHWLGATDHNHLRITRIIKSLRLLVSDAAADRFRAEIVARVEAAGGKVSAASRRYWDAA